MLTNYLRAPERAAGRQVARHPDRIPVVGSGIVRARGQCHHRRLFHRPEGQQAGSGARREPVARRRNRQAAARRWSRRKTTSRISAPRPICLSATTTRNLANQQLTELTTQLAAARGQKADLDAKSRLIRDMLNSGKPIEAVRRHQFRSDPPPDRAARDTALATCRAILDLARPASAHQGTESADLRARFPDPRRGREDRPYRRERRPHRRRAHRDDERRDRAAEEADRRHRAARTCSCARSSAKPRRSAIFWNPISPNIARRARAIRSMPRPPTCA